MTATETDEAAFQAAIDANPSDNAIRLVFADWLEERGDPRAEGYRALGRLGRVPTWAVWVAGVNEGWSYQRGGDGLSLLTWDGYPEKNVLPTDWSNLVGPHHVQQGLAGRRTLEDFAAAAFAGLPAERRAELLRPEARP